jgi:hypothetical protein
VIPQLGPVSVKVNLDYILILVTNSMITLVDGEERGRGTASRKYVAMNIAASVALASLRQEDP